MDANNMDGALMCLDVAFIGATAVVGHVGALPELPTGLAFAALLGIAAFRAGRALSFNLIFEPMRRRLGVVVLPDSSGAGDNCHATGSGIRRALGELVTCPICAGTWSAVALIALTALAPWWGRVLVYALAAAGCAELLHWLSEALEWNGRHAREQAGFLNRQSRGER